jgi:hypothetical protein
MGEMVGDHKPDSQIFKEGGKKITSSGTVELQS